MEEKRILRRRMVFTGRVQGVGFRWRASQAAQLYGCTGWVQNEWDGSVTMELQGTGDGIDLVLQALRRSRYIQIEQMISRGIPEDPDERGFHTR